MFRIQKLMVQEYRDIYEPVIVENPFTQVRACGEGLRQYHIGLTRSQIIFACDDFHYVKLDEFSFNGIDPEIETFQLVSSMPLKCLQFNFYRKCNRKIMQICICGERERPMLFEFGGHLYKSLFWNIWRERLTTIKLLYSDRLYGSSFSNDSAAEENNIYNQQQLDLSFSCSQSTGRSYASSCCLINH